MRVMVLGGAGAVASETTNDLYYNSSFDEIVIADYDLAKAQKMVDELLENGHNRVIPDSHKCEANKAEFYTKKISAIQVDAAKVIELATSFKGFDVIACGLPFKYDLQVTEAAVIAGVDALDLGFAEEQLDFDGRAKAKNIAYVPGMGATPGITNAMARRGIEKLDEAESVMINFAAYRCLAPAPGLLNTTMWEFDPDTKERLYYENGKMIAVDPFTGQKMVKFHDLIGEQEVVYIPHPETSTISASYPQLKYVDVRGTFPPHIMRLMKALLESGLYSKEEVGMYGKKVSCYKAIHDLLLQVPESRLNSIWAYGLVVEVRGRKNGKACTYLYSNSHPSQSQWGGERAYYKNVGIPLAIGAEMLAGNRAIPRGVVPPELAIEPVEFFEKLATRGINVTEHVTE